MTESHIRINLTANWTALQNLGGSSYKVLMVLAARADCYGRCYPGTERIAFDAHYHVQTVYEAISELLTYGYIKILQKAQFNPITGQKMATVYQVSPYFLELADKFIEYAITLWNNFGKNVSESFPESNQQQNYVPESVPNNQYQNQQQQPTTDSENKGQKDKSELPKTEQKFPQQAQAQQRSLPIPNSAIVKKYTNPILVQHPLADELSESLAKRIAHFGLRITLTRGLICEYGYAACLQAAKFVEFTRENQDIENAAGFYRSVLQRDLYQFIAGASLDHNDQRWDNESLSINY